MSTEGAWCGFVNCTATHFPSGKSMENIFWYCSAAFMDPFCRSLEDVFCDICGVAVVVVVV